MNDVKKIHLRAMEPEDIEAIYNWENDAILWVYSATHQPFSKHDLKQFINESQGNDIYVTRQLRLMCECDGNTVGCIDLYDFDPFNRRAAIGIIVDSQYRGIGYGGAMLDELESFAKEHLQLHLLYCTVATDNKNSIHLFEKHGYTHSGTLKEWLCDGDKRKDAAIMQKIIGTQTAMPVEK